MKLRTDFKTDNNEVKTKDGVKCKCWQICPICNEELPLWFDVKAKTRYISQCLSSAVATHVMFAHKDALAEINTDKFIAATRNGNILIETGCYTDERGIIIDYDVFFAKTISAKKARSIIRERIDYFSDKIGVMLSVFDKIA